MLSKLSEEGMAGFPWCLSGKESACQCRRQVPSLIRDDPTCLRATKAIAPQLLSLCSRAREPQLLKSAHPRACVPQQEKPLQWEACVSRLDSGPRSLQLEQSLHSNEDPTHPEININTLKKNFKAWQTDTQEVLVSQPPLQLGWSHVTGF